MRRHNIICRKKEKQANKDQLKVIKPIKTLKVSLIFIVLSSDNEESVSGMEGAFKYVA